MTPDTIAPVPLSARERVLRILGDSGSYETMEDVADALLDATRAAPVAEVERLREAVIDRARAVCTDWAGDPDFGPALDPLIAALTAYHNGDAPASDVIDAADNLRDAGREWLNQLAAEMRPALDAEHAERYVQTRAVIEYADVRRTGDVVNDITGKNGVWLSDADWNRVVAVARGHVSTAARKVIERVITGNLS